MYRNDRKMRKFAKITQRAVALLSALCALLILSATFAGCSEKSDRDSVPAPSQPSDLTYSSPYEKKFGRVIKAEIVFKDFGTVKVDLYPDEAPITVENFVNLAKSGFYDGLTIHRVSPGFVIQGGDPTGTGSGDPDQAKIKGEFAANGEVNRISHVRGVLSMARAGYSYDSATSQFFVMLADNTQVGHLNGNYAAFGCVTDGMDVIDAIGALDVYPGTDRPFTPPVIESVKILDD